MSSLTAVNSTIMLSVTGVYPIPQQLQGFTADDVFDLDEIDVAETIMGIDGILSGGFIYVEKPWSVSLQANSPSCQIFDTWYNYQQSIGDIASASMQIALPGLGYKWAYSNGILKRYSPAPSVKKMVQPRKFTIVWNTIGASPI